MFRFEATRCDTLEVQQYSLGPREVPVDICPTPRVQPIERVRSRPLRRSAGTPALIDARDERTARLTLPESNGPTHVELDALAEGRGEPVTLGGRFYLDRCLGHGGMATVFGGRLLSVGREVALKIMDGERGLREDGLDRFLAEARILGEIRHPNIVDVFDCGSTAEGLIYMVMELLDGQDLRTLVKREGPLSRERVQALMADVCAGLAAVHERGVVHRDLKPANCFLTATGVKLLDFGIASSIGASPSVRGTRLVRDDGQRLTQDGRIVGTPEYMSPEQAHGDVVDARSDVYAAGILLGELLTGHVPFQAKTRVAIIDAQINEAPPTLAELAGHSEGQTDPKLAAFEAIYARALDKDPDARYQTIEAFAEAVAAVGDPARWWQRPRRLLGAVARAAALL